MSRSHTAYLYYGLDILDPSSSEDTPLTEAWRAAQDEHYTAEGDEEEEYELDFHNWLKETYDISGVGLEWRSHIDESVWFIYTQCFRSFDACGAEKIEPPLADTSVDYAMMRKVCNSLGLDFDKLKKDGKVGWFLGVSYDC